MFNVKFLEQIRRAEIEFIKTQLDSSIKTVLEIGGGSGFQAKELSKLGFKVVSVDIKPAEIQHYLVEKFDGETLPFPDRSFDLVFSSNTLEHVENLPILLGEIKRVLGEGAISIHTMPTGSWAFWTFWAHFIDAVHRSYKTNFPDKSKEINSIEVKQSIVFSLKRIPRLIQDIKLKGWPLSHGGKFNPVCEWIYFSEAIWRRRFKSNKVELTRVIPIPLFYTGYMIFENKIGPKARKALSFILGSSSKMYLTKN